MVELWRGLSKASNRFSFTERAWMRFGSIASVFLSKTTTAVCNENGEIAELPGLKSRIGV